MNTLFTYRRLVVTIIECSFFHIAYLLDNIVLLLQSSGSRTPKLVAIKIPLLISRITKKLAILTLKDGAVIAERTTSKMNWKERLAE